MNVSPHILLADDEKSVLQALGEILRREGFTCTAVSDGHAAVDALQKHRFDTLIADIKMAGNVHLELVKEVPRLADGLPVILITGHPTLQTAIESIHLPVVAYLVKPFEIPVLLRHVREAVQRSQLFGRVLGARRRLEESSQALKDILASLSQVPPKESTAALTGFVGLTLRQVLDALLNLEETAARSEGEAASPVALLGAQRQMIRETLAVLEKTKAAFKSKDLGRLRRKIETFLGEH